VHRTQDVVPLVAVCKPYPELQAVIVTVPFAAIVHVAAPAPQYWQLGLPDVGVSKAYPAWHVASVTLTVTEAAPQV